MVFRGLCSVCKLAYALMVIGALNWGLVGIGMFVGKDLNVVELLLGRWPVVVAIIYVLVGLGGVFGLLGTKCTCKRDGAMPM